MNNEVKNAIKLLRERLGKRGEHHPNCSLKQKAGKCDCYAHGREESHEALDCIMSWCILNSGRKS